MADVEESPLFKDLIKKENDKKMKAIEDSWKE